MGLIQAAVGAAGGVLADQWKEFFYCEALDNETLMVKGQKRIGPRSTNTKGNDNIISNGSGIAVADGQCMIIVEQGKVVDLCAEPGEYTYDTSTEPSIFTGSLKKSIIDTFKVVGKRFTYGGDTGKDQRVYYFNTKEIIDNKFGSANPIPFRVVDRNIGLDIDVAVRCSGLYSYKIADPLLFYKSLSGNVEKDYKKAEIDTQLKSEFVSALQPAFGAISELEIRPNQLVSHTDELEKAMNDALSYKWGELRGLEVVSVALSSLTLPDEDQQRIKDAQLAAINRDPRMAGATITQATADVMRGAATNEGGAMNGFVGIGMANTVGGQAANLFATAQQEEAAKAAAAAQANAWKCECGATATGNFCPQCGKAKPAPAAGWKCECGATATGNFCPNCGKAKPAPAAGWQCECGTTVNGNFCPNCGKAKPAAAPSFKCNKCGWVPEDPKNPPKFCPQCGDAFDSSDIQ